MADSGTSASRSKSEDESLDHVAGRKRKLSADFKEPRKKANKEKSTSAEESTIKSGNDNDLDELTEPEKRQDESDTNQFDEDELQKSLDAKSEEENIKLLADEAVSAKESPTLLENDQNDENSFSKTIDFPLSRSIDQGSFDETNVNDNALENEPSVEIVDEDIPVSSENVTSPVQKKRKKRIPSILRDLELLPEDIVDNQVVGDSIDKDEEEGQGGGRYQSSRNAAKVAKSKFSNNNKNNKAGDSSKQPRKTKGAEKSVEQPVVVEAKTEWIQCDSCSKWRSIPPSAGINIETLPEKWFCSMNDWDPDRNTCETEEEQYQTAEFSTVEAVDGALQVNDTALHSGGNQLLNSTAKGKNKGKAKKVSVVEGNEFAIKDEGAINKEVTSGKKKVQAKANQRNVSSVEGLSSAQASINWVQCNKCKKWRKAPNVDDLPDKWFCSLNTWNSNYASCSVRQEEDDTAAENNILANQTPHRGGRKVSQQQTSSHAVSSSSTNATTEAVSGSAVGNAVLKKTSWVQCERKGCKKWRKVPASIDIDSLPEKWYCEMNTWNPDSASCDAPEDVDSDTERNENESRNQFILAGPKGPSALSYRRIIFGNDGKIKACFSDKNKNGQGLFSCNLPVRKVNNNNMVNSDENVEDEYQEPLKKIPYWWSSAYKDQCSEENSDSFCAIDAIQRLADVDEATTLPKFNCVKKVDPGWKIAQSLPLLSRFNAECSIIRSCFFSQNLSQITFPSLVQGIQQSKFLNPVVESCRRFFTNRAILDALRRLEESDEVEIAFNSSNEMIIAMLKPLSSLRTSVASRSKVFHLKETQTANVGTKWAKRGVPLKMRKFFVARREDQVIRESQNNPPPFSEEDETMVQSVDEYDNSRLEYSESSNALMAEDSE